MREAGGASLLRVSGRTRISAQGTNSFYYTVASHDHILYASPDGLRLHLPSPWQPIGPANIGEPCFVLPSLPF